MVVDIDPVLIGNGQLAIELRWRANPRIGVADQVGVRQQEGGGNRTACTNAEIRRGLILEVGPLQLRPPGVVVDVLGDHLHDCRKLFREARTKLQPQLAVHSRGPRLAITGASGLEGVANEIGISRIGLNHAQGAVAVQRKHRGSSVLVGGADAARAA